MQNSLTIYGIRNCDTVKRARSALDDAGVEYRFHDFKSDGLDLDTAKEWLAQLGAEKVLNRRGTTWRKLSPADQERAEKDPASLIVDHPSLVKRPVWDRAGSLRVGFARGEAEEIVKWAAL
tara:strand:+ start:2823 stop:3185 length:363 start_codon:yes stop_codon:yes gene_type:complete